MYDVIIIGAGSAGLAARKEIARETSNYLVVDGGPIGTVCARVGCMPSKVLIEAANVYHQRRKFADIGVAGADQLRLDGKAFFEHVRALRDQYVQSVINDMKAWMPTHFKAGMAHFTDRQTIMVNGEKLEAKRFIVATGSRPNVKPAWARTDGVITTDDLFELDTLPKTLGVVGLGPVGVEMAQAMARLGVKVTAFSRKDSVAGFSDPKLISYAKQAFRRDFEFIEAETSSLTAHEKQVRVRTEHAAFDFDKVLVATGRKPNLAKLQLENAGVTLKDGHPHVNGATYRIEGTHLYLIGDVNGKKPVLHEAVDQGRIAGLNAISHEDQKQSCKTPLRIAFTTPNSAQVGRSWKKLKEENIDFICGEVCFENQGRAVAMMDKVGHLAIYAERKSGKVLGAEIFTPAGEHFAHLLAWAITDEKTVLDLLAQPFYHPVLEEGLRTALKEAATQIDQGSMHLKTVRADDPAAGTSLGIENYGDRP